MPTIRLMPYGTPAFQSAECDIEVLAPARDPDAVASAWSPGMDLSLRARSRVHDSFRREGGLRDSEPLHLVLVVSCAWTRWEMTEAREIDGQGTSVISVLVPGTSIANSVDVHAHIVGDGDRMSSRDKHRAAKLWTSEPLRIPLTTREGMFPTSAISFSKSSGLRPVPWKLEVSDYLEAGTHVSDGVRLLINTDFDVGRRLAAGVQSGAALDALRIDIMLSMIEAVAELPESDVSGVDPAENPLSIAGVAAKLARDLGLDLGAALHISSSRPGELREIAMASVGFLAGELS